MYLMCARLVLGVFIVRAVCVGVFGVRASCAGVLGVRARGYTAVPVLLYEVTGCLGRSRATHAP